MTRGAPIVHVVEDDDDQYILVEHRLQGAWTAADEPAPEVVRSRSLAEATAREAATPSRLVLLDLGLPDSGVTDTARRFMAAVPRARVVALSALDDPDLARAALASGARAFMAKSDFDGALLTELWREAQAPLQAATGARREHDGDGEGAPRAGERDALERLARQAAHDALGHVQTVLLRARGLGRRAGVEGAPHVDAIVAACSDLEQLVQGLRATTVAELAPLRVERADAVALEVLALSAPATLRLEADAPPPGLRADHAALARAIGELVDNAARHAAGATHVAVRYSQAARDGRPGWLVRVADDGRPGAAASWAERAFEPCTSEGPTAGAGLGLFRVRRCVERHGGDVRVELAPRGVTVELWIPEAPDADARASR